MSKTLPGSRRGLVLRLEAARVAAAMTYEQLAKEISVSVATLRRWFHRGIGPRAGTAQEATVLSWLHRRSTR